MKPLCKRPDCGDNSCIYAASRGGMRTNGGCRCNPREVQRYIESLESICAETYQVVGALAYHCGMFEDPQTQRVLDNLSQCRKVHKTVLPYVIKEKGKS